MKRGREQRGKKEYQEDPHENYDKNKPGLYFCFYLKQP